ncbi:MAG: hypothetical protein QOD99_2171, partial [Chthoniobacter sp.]|nr:hypothetical protein [Chthoniobacter sp.]
MGTLRGSPGASWPGEEPAAAEEFVVLVATHLRSSLPPQRNVGGSI